MLHHSSQEWKTRCRELLGHFSLWFGECRKQEVRWLIQIGFSKITDWAWAMQSDTLTWNYFWASVFGIPRAWCSHSMFVCLFTGVGAFSEFGQKFPVRQMLEWDFACHETWQCSISSQIMNMGGGEHRYNCWTPPLEFCEHLQISCEPNAAEILSAKCHVGCGAVGGPAMQLHGTASFLGASFLFGVLSWGWICISLWQWDTFWPNLEEAANDVTA